MNETAAEVIDQALKDGATNGQEIVDALRKAAGWDGKPREWNMGYELTVYTKKTIWIAVIATIIAIVGIVMVVLW